MLSEQEIIRRDNLQKIKELGINPYPPEKFEVNFSTSDFTTNQYHINIVNFLKEIKGIGDVGAENLKGVVLKNRFKAGVVLQDESVKELNLSEEIEFDSDIDRPSMSFEAYLGKIREDAVCDSNGDKFNKVKIAGRFMGQRGPFAKLQDASGRIQLYIGKKNLGETEEEKERFNKLLKLLDIGDTIGVHGELFATQTGEVSIRVSDLTFLSKSLRPLPIVKRDKEGNIYDAFTDPELRYRQRYVDLIVNREIKDIFIARSRVISGFRKYFDSKGWLEVETPVLQPIHGGASARPFKTHHNTLDMPHLLHLPHL